MRFSLPLVFALVLLLFSSLNSHPISPILNNIDGLEELENLDESSIEGNLKKEAGPIHNLEYTVQKVTELLQTMQECNNIPGISVGIVIEGETRFISFGTSDGEHPVDPNTNFNIGSITKTMSSILTALYDQEGLVDWEMPIKKYDKKFDLINSEKLREKQLTLLDLIEIQSGYPNYGYDFTWAWGYNGDRENYFQNLLKHMKPVAPLRLDNHRNKLSHLLFFRSILNN
eukprot:TRINITY_DN10349_c0_g1_i4.p1 TRINITY_DN10349_c0_g1~~TRINITY_DN10349_c0_g1_i4.p1  ORF type:complete len:229 (+),score=24.93 TRINITY_DN10349_c0_g1_i4:82-768(+)